MRRTIVVVAATALVALVVAGCSASPTSTGSGTSGSTSSGSGASGTSKKADVAIKGFAFTPSSVTVAVGGTVTWTNDDSASHAVTGQGWDSGGTVASGATFTHTFDKAGTYAYACTIHPSMTGEVVVK